MLDRKLIVMLYNNGHGYSEIGRQLNVSKQRIHQIVQVYKNHGFKRFRKKTRKILEGQPCGICRQPSSHLHHKDRNNTNDDINNLIPLCLKCHKEIHIGEKRTYKFPPKQLEVTFPNRHIWSVKYSQCKQCSTTKIKHGSHGLCVNCYMYNYRKKNEQEMKKGQY